MANYASLKAAIQEVVKTNGKNEITGALLQQSLLAMITSLGAGYQYVGIATPSTNPGTPDHNVFYLASTVGTYSNFSGFVLTDGEIAILKYNGVWSMDLTGSASLEYVNQLGQKVIDPSEYSPFGYFIDSSGSLVPATSEANSVLIDANGAKVTVKANSSYGARVAFLRGNSTSAPEFCYGETGRHDISAGQSASYDIPEDCVYIYIAIANNEPEEVYVSGSIFEVVEASDLDSTNPIFLKVYAASGILSQLNPGEYGYNSVTKKIIYKIDSNRYKNLPPQADKLYIYGGILYVWDGTGLQSIIEDYPEKGSGVSLSADGAYRAMRAVFVNKAGYYDFRPSGLSDGDAYLNLSTNKVYYISDTSSIEVAIFDNQKVVCGVDEYVKQNGSFQYIYPTFGLLTNYESGFVYAYTGETTEPAKTAAPSWKCAKINVVAGDVFWFKGTGGNSSRLYIVKDSSNNDVEVAPAGTVVSHITRLEISQAGCVYFNFSDSAPFAIYGTAISRIGSKEIRIPSLRQGGIRYDGLFNTSLNRATIGPLYEGHYEIGLNSGYEFKTVFFYKDGELKTTKTINAQIAEFDVAVGTLAYAVLWKGDGTMEIESLLDILSFYEHTPSINAVYQQINQYNSLYKKGRVYSEIQPMPNYTGQQSDYTFGVVGTTKTADIYAAFDALVDNDFIFKKKIGTSGYNDTALYVYYTNPSSPSITEDFVGVETSRIPTIIIIGGLHGNEQSNIFGMYFFMKDLCEKYMDNETLRFLHQNVRIVMYPCSNPYGIDNFTYHNQNHVNLNRNFEVAGWYDPADGDTTSAQYAGQSAFDQPETAAIRDSILSDFKDAIFLFDYHMRDNAGQPSPVNSLIFEQYPLTVKYDEYVQNLVRAGWWHLMNCSTLFQAQYHQYIGGGKNVICGSCIKNQPYSLGYGYSNEWAVQNGIAAMAVEGFAGFPLDFAINTNDLCKKANSENIGNFIATILWFLNK